MLLLLSFFIPEQMVIPDFGEFTEVIEELFEECKDIRGGKVGTPAA